MTIDRRSLLLGSTAPLFALSGNRFSICSETFVGMSFAKACKVAKRIGYAGIEIDPAHLSADPASLIPSERREIRRTIAAEGLRYVGLHSFLKAPAGLHLTAPDKAVRRKSWDYFAHMVDLAADLGDKPVMVLGSSKQRATVDGATQAEAVQRLKDGLPGLTQNAELRGVSILMEPLAPNLCNVVNTLAEALEIVRYVKSPAVQTILDTHNTAAETLPIDVLIREHFPSIRHVHLNEMDGRRPGTAGFPFESVLRTLKLCGYTGWVSVEVFDFKPDGETVARQAYEFLQGVENRV